MSDKNNSISRSIKDNYYDDGSDKAFIDYIPEADTRPYPVYRNDIKFRQHRNIDPSRAVWDNDVQCDFHNKDTDCISYRIEECIREKGEMIDLSHMNKDCFNLLMSNNVFPKIKNKLQHIFAKDCNLLNLPNLDCCSALLTLDISSNNLISLPKLPESLEELIVNDNRITEVSNNLPNLLRFNGDNNLICNINFSKTLERIHLKNNPIIHIPGFENLYFLDISTTKINKLYSCPQLKYLDISYTEIITLPDMESLQSLICVDSSLTDITKLKNLYSLDMVRSKINRIPYFKNLHTLNYDDGAKFGMSRNYRIKYFKKSKMNIIEMKLDTQ
jgi:hypothetical protein